MSTCLEIQMQRTLLHSDFILLLLFSFPHKNIIHYARKPNLISNALLLGAEAVINVFFFSRSLRCGEFPPATYNISICFPKSFCLYKPHDIFIFLSKTVT